MDIYLIENDNLNTDQNVTKKVSKYRADLKID